MKRAQRATWRTKGGRLGGAESSLSSAKNAASREAALQQHSRGARCATGEVMNGVCHGQTQRGARPAAGKPRPDCHLHVPVRAGALDLWAVQAATSFLSKGIPRR